MPTRPVRLFISYATRDRDLKKQLDTHLALLRRQGLIEMWGERSLEADLPDASVDQDNPQLATAEIVMLLITPSFMASDYCYAGEMTQAIELHRSGDLRVIPIIARPVDMSGAPFAKLQGLPSNHKAIVKWSDQDDAWLDVVRGLRTIVQTMAARPPRDVQAQPARAASIAPTVPVPQEAGDRTLPIRLYERLERLLPVQFEKVLFFTQLSPSLLPAESAGQARRAMELVRLFQQKGERALLSLEKAINQAVL